MVVSLLLPLKTCAWQLSAPRPSVAAKRAAHRALHHRHREESFDQTVEDAMEPKRMSLRKTHWPIAKMQLHVQLYGLEVEGSKCSEFRVAKTARDRRSKGVHVNVAPLGITLARTMRES